MKSEETIFKQGSTTYYWSSKFFPPRTRQDVYKLYSFVRVADDFVDTVPADIQSFNQLEKTWHKFVSGKKVAKKQNDTIYQVCKNMHDVVVKYDFDTAWVDAFLASMRMDIAGKTYKTLDDTLEYIYGSAEVIGLMMAKTIGVPESAYEYAKLQGRAMQYINFLRDIAEDIKLGRCYFPQSELKKYGLPRLTEAEAHKHPAAYREFIEAQLTYYHEWQTKANNGFKTIPRKQRVALHTAVDMYNWTAEQLAKNPYVVFDKKVKPTKYRVVARAMRRTLRA